MWFSIVNWCHKQGHEKSSGSPRETEGEDRTIGMALGEESRVVPLVAVR